jgi:primosomal replication protein N
MGKGSERGILQQPAVKQGQQHGHEVPAAVKRLQVAGVVQVGAEEIDVFAGDKIMGQVLAQLTVITSQRKQVDLEKAAQGPELVVYGFIACIENITLRMSQHGLVSFYLEIK